MPHGIIISTVSYQYHHINHPQQEYHQLVVVAAAWRSGAAAIRGSTSPGGKVSKGVGGEGG